MLFSSCGFIEKIEQRLNRDSVPKVKEDADLMSIAEQVDRSLKNKIIVFGHQSVGENIIEGLADIGRQDQRFNLTLKQVNSPAEIDGPGFYHFAVGENHKPQRKLEHFQNFIAQVKHADIAFMKFCYVDFKDTTDLDNLLAGYNAMIDSLRKIRPETKFVHFTCPYRSEEDQLNAIRNQYNEKFRTFYGSRGESIFDLATIESTKKDGSRASYRLGEQTFYRMHLPYTKDSGHLNAAGRYRVAKQLLINLLKYT